MRHRPVAFRRDPDCRLTRNPEVLGCRAAAIRHFFVLNDLPLVECRKAGSFDGRDVHKHVFTAAAGWLNEPVAFGRIEVAKAPTESWSRGSEV